MSNRRNARQEKKAFATGANQTFDSYQNFIAHVGRGTGNQGDGGNYGFNPVSRNRLQMEWVYRGSWIAGRVVDVYAQDMTREGVDITSSDPPKKTAKFNKYLAKLQVWSQLCQTIKWARLYGGALAFMMIDGQNPSTPLRIETIQKNQFKGLLPMDRWVVNPSLQDLVQDFGPHIGKPKFYETIPDTGGVPLMKIHYSRVIRILGVELPYWQAISENLWGQSELERMWDRLVAFDSTTMGIAQLVYKAHLRTLSIENLREAIAAGGPAMKGIIAQVNAIRTFQSNEGLTLLDSKDLFETHQYSFGGLDAILMQFGEQLAGATGIPLARLFGQSPAGFDNGDSTMRNYHEGVKQAQVNQLGDGVETVYRVAYVSKFGTEPPEEFELDFKPLAQMTHIEKSQVTNTTTAAVNTAFESQIISKVTALKELKQLGRLTGTFANISDEEIASAEALPDPSPEAMGLVLPEPAAAPAGGAKPGAGARPKNKAAA